MNAVFQKNVYLTVHFFAFLPFPGGAEQRNEQDDDVK